MDQPNVSLPCPTRWRFDVLVVGGGSAGCAAAIAAARTGAKVGLVERYGFLGGTGTAVLDTFYGFYTPGQKARKVVGGIPDDVVTALRRRGAALERPNTYGAGTGVTYDPEILKVVWETLALEAGVQALYHLFFVAPVLEGTACRGAILAGKGGLVRATARVVVDATGDADVAATCGAPGEVAGRDGPQQPLTTTFRLANVDTEHALQVKQDQLWALMRQANAGGSFQLPREEGSVHVTPYPGIMATNMSRVTGYDPLDPEQLTAAEREGRRQALEYARFLREMVPGYERAVLCAFSVGVGIRETRRIVGDYRLTGADVMGARQFDDQIALCGAPIEDHGSGTGTTWAYIPDSGAYGIPYRCLLPQRVEGLLVAGRCLSATHEAHASVRSMAQCMAMGQAAGTAAALAVRTGAEPRGVAADAVRERLADAGAVLE